MVVSTGHFVTAQVANPFLAFALLRASLAAGFSCLFSRTNAGLFRAGVPLDLPGTFRYRDH